MVFLIKASPESIGHHQPGAVLIPDTFRLDQIDDRRIVAVVCARFIMNTFSCTNDPLATSRAKYAPTLTEFITDTIGRACLPAPVVFYALRLLLRVKEQRPNSKCISGHRLFISAFMVAAKYLKDGACINRFWFYFAQTLFSLREINRMEREMCDYLGWVLRVEPQDLYDFGVMLQCTFGRAAPTPMLTNTPPTLPPALLALASHSNSTSSVSLMSQPADVNRSSGSLGSLKPIPPLAHDAPSPSPSPSPTLPLLFAQDCLPYLASPSQSSSPYPGYLECPPKAPSCQRSPAPCKCEERAPGGPRHYDPQIDIDQEHPRRDYWPEDQAHPSAHPLDSKRCSATPDGTGRNRGPEAPTSPLFHTPPRVQLNEGSGRGSSTRLPQMAPMDIDRAPPPPSLLFRSQSQGSNQLPPPPAIAAGASYPDPNRHTRSPSPLLPLPGNYSSRPGPNALRPSTGYPGGYPNGDAWDRERSGCGREARDREPSRDSRGGRQRQPSMTDRVQVEILNQPPPTSDRFFPNQCRPSLPVASRYDPRRSPPPAERQPGEGRSPYLAAPSHNAPCPGYCERERGVPPKPPSHQHSLAPREREGLAPGGSRHYDPRMDIDREPPRRGNYWPEDQAHLLSHPLDSERYSASPDSTRRNCGSDAPTNGSESPIPGGSRAHPEPVGKTARRRGAQAVAPREQPPAPPPLKEKKDRKPPSKRGGRESSAAPEREMSAPAPRAPGSAPVSQAAPSQHPAFKVSMPENNTLPPPPVPGGANHHRTQSGSNGSARSRATPSPTMGPPRREVDEDYDEGVADALMGLSGLKRSRTTLIHLAASPGSHGLSSLVCEVQHTAFAPPITPSLPVSTSCPSPTFSRPVSSLPPHPSSPQPVRNGHSPPGLFARHGSELPCNKTPLSLKREMDDEGAGPLEKRHRVDVLNPVPLAFPPPRALFAQCGPVSI